MKKKITNISKKKNERKDSVIFDVVEFGSSSRVSVLHNIVHTDNTGYFSLVDKTPKSNKDKTGRKNKKGRAS
ncbi:MAG: hypothetical protein LWX07_06210 [Bacteroidetes bacterium]|nr:hypothetical protein [Bacteroidota bacterium]